jgi:hypothetical protein
MKGNEMKADNRFLKALALAAMIVGLLGCAVQQGQEYSGFLQTYPPFEKGAGGVDKRYIKEGVDFSKYDKIMMDEVVFFFREDADYKGIYPSDIAKLSEEFHKAFAEELGDILTDVPAPNVVRMRLAVTDLELSSPVAGTITTVIPVGLAINFIKKGTTGEYVGVGSASMEAEFLDSISNIRIAAAVDKAPGGKLDLGKFSAAKSAFQFWAKRLSIFITETRIAE